MVRLNKLCRAQHNACAPEIWVRGKNKKTKNKKCGKKKKKRDLARGMFTGQDGEFRTRAWYIGVRR